MTAIGLWLVMAVAAAVIGRRVAAHLTVAGPLRRANYRGLELPTGVGIAVIVATAGAMALARLWFVAQPDAGRLLNAVVLGPSAMGVMLGFGLLGLWDDIAGTPGERGWMSHVRALRAARPTAGALKLAAGAAIALVVTPGPGLGWTLVNAATIALSANLFNLLDLRPGRCGKVALLALLGLMIAGSSAGAHLAAAFGAIAAVLPFDLRERAMLGDTGANAIGALIGYALVVTASHLWLLIALAVLIAINAAGQRPGLSALIDAARPLRSFDRLGRAPHANS